MTYALRGSKKPKITFYASGSGTHTPDADCTSLYAEVKAGGGGGGGSGNATGNVGVTGTTSSFGVLSAVGGTGGQAGNAGSGGTGGAGGTASGGDINLTGLQGDSPIQQATTFYWSARGGGPGSRMGIYGAKAGFAALANSGSGGEGGGIGGTSMWAGAGGGEGGFSAGTFNNTGGVSYAVGGGGAGGAAGTNGFAGGNGGSGYVMVIEYFW